MDHIKAQANAFDKIVEAFETPESRWLANLPEYDCPICGDKTIFKDGCPGCYHDEETV